MCSSDLISDSASERPDGAHQALLDDVELNEVLELVLVLDEILLVEVLLVEVLLEEVLLLLLLLEKLISNASISRVILE